MNGEAIIREAVASQTDQYFMEVAKRLEQVLSDASHLTEISEKADPGMIVELSCLIFHGVEEALIEIVDLGEHCVDLLS